MPENIESHVEEILSILDKKTDEKPSKDEIKKEFEKFMEYGVPVNQAKQTILKKYGEEETVFSQNTSDERVLISNLKPNQSSVKILGHVIAINPKEVTVRGENKKIFYGILGDESGTIPFTSWTEIDVEKGDVVEISNAYTKEWQGNVQLNIGDRVNIEKTDKDKLPDTAFKPKEYNVGDLRSGIGQVEVTAKILDINKREVTVNGSKKSVFSGIIADETGKAQFTSWHDFKIKKDEVLKISGGYVKTWKGIPQLTFDENSDVKKLDKKEISSKNIKTKTMPMHKLADNRGGLGVEVEGTIIDIRPGSGFIKRCPECNRALQDSKCNIHGEVDGIEDMRLKLIVDDGTGAVNATLNEELSRKVLGKNKEELKKMDETEIEELYREKIFAKKVSLKGNALSDDFGLTFIPKDIEFVDIDVDKEAEKLRQELEEM